MGRTSRIWALALTVGLAPLWAGAAQPADGDARSTCQRRLAEQIDELKSAIERWRGLEFKEAVVAECSHAMPEGIAGWYDPSESRLYVSPSAQGPFARGVLLHELVHVLQDQHFDLEKLYQKTDDTEARAVLQTMLEGEAMLAVIELLDYDFDRVSADAALDPAGRLSFYRDGSRFVRAVREACGWSEVGHLLARRGISRDALVTASRQGVTSCQLARSEE